MNYPGSPIYSISSGFSDRSYYSYEGTKKDAEIVKNELISSLINFQSFYYDYLQEISYQIDNIIKSVCDFKMNELTQLESLIDACENQATEAFSDFEMQKLLITLISKACDIFTQDSSFTQTLISINANNMNEINDIDELLSLFLKAADILNEHFQSLYSTHSTSIQDHNVDGQRFLVACERTIERFKEIDTIFENPNCNKDKEL